MALLVDQQRCVELSHIGLRIHQDIVVSSTMLEDPADLIADLARGLAAAAQ